jgi:hypothetical protein
LEFIAMSKVDDRVFTFTLTPEFRALYQSVRQQHQKFCAIDSINQRVLGLDPGETTGVAGHDGKGQITVFQKVTKDIGQSFDWLVHTINGGNPAPECRSVDHIRAEDYRVYEWKSDDHRWSPIHTVQLIGGIRCAAHVTNTPISFMMAQQAKKWWTDSKLADFGMNPRGLTHGRDALRHLLYYILFPTL